MKRFQKDSIPDLEWQAATKKVIPIKVVQIQEPFIVETMEGSMTGKAGDYLVVGIKGDIYPIDQQIFEETYDLLT